MTTHRFFTAAAWGSLTGALLLAAVPLQAQDSGRGWGREGRAGAVQQGSGYRSDQRAARPAPQAAPRGTARSGSGNGWSGQRDASPNSQRDNGGGRDWAAQRQAREAAGQQQRQGSWAGSSDRRIAGTGTAGWQGNRSSGSDARTGDWQRDRSYGANTRTREWQRQDAARAERRDDNRNYTRGYRDGRRDDNRYDNRYGQNQRRWDNRSWRSDNRYDWYRYRASNRALFSPGRYYAPARGYSYSRISIGFRLGSPFYANRYWINDPWQYRLPAAYGPYRWVRYYDDALLVDVYSGEVVDAIHNFFW